MFGLLSRIKKIWIDRRCFLIFSRGIRRLIHLRLFLHGILPHTRGRIVVGWGYKPSSLRARCFAQDHGLPYVALEDGFFRSVGLGIEGTQPFSVVADAMGIYYQAAEPSSLERLIKASCSLQAADLARAQYCLNLIRENRLSKYNVSRSDACLKVAKPRVLVVDQTQGDVSVEGALSSAEDFLTMLRVALDSHPNDIIWIKVHPDVVAGKKCGFLWANVVAHPRIRWYSKSVNPWDFLDTVTDVYTVSSLLGFEALIAGAKVHCFGVPFYAGWGLTTDRLICKMRNVPRSLEQVFFAAYIQYAHYVDPIHHHVCELEDILCYVCDVVRQRRRAKQKVKLIGISRWKRHWLRDFLYLWQYTLQENSVEQLLFWGMHHSEFTDAYRIEDGFIRSVGLGVHFHTPMSLVCDRVGLYYDATRASELENYINQGECAAGLKTRAAHLIDQIVTLGVTKYNVGESSVFVPPQDKVVILVIGQVESDASLRYGSPVIKTNAALLEQTRQDNPNAFIIFKPHPDVVAGQRDDGQWHGSYLTFADQIDVTTSLNVWFSCIDELHTMTSLSGFEALLRKIPVTTYGMPFYAGWGLTQDKISCPRRNILVSLESLVAAVLIVYPIYLVPKTKQVCSVEQILFYINQSQIRGANQNVIYGFFYKFVSYYSTIKKLKINLMKNSLITLFKVKLFRNSKS